MMSNFKKINDLTGWVIFILASLVYILTVEPTASFWDPGEFIAVAYKLQVPHPPGAPFFLLVYRFFSFFAFGDTANVAYAMNIGSALLSGFTILFLFWTITLIARKMLGIVPGEEKDTDILKVMAAGVIGSLVYTFSDSFWFSAVETEVYAMSSFFTAIVIWAFFKWDTIKDPQQENKWLIFIAYLVGLSIGVHLLNLVTLPALALIYYFKKYQPTAKGIAMAVLSGGVALIIINNIIIPGLPSMAGKLEIFMVNSIGLPFGSGVLLFTALFVGSLVYGVFYSIKKQKVMLNTALLCLTFILIGYASYAMIVVRSNANPPIDENDPQNVLSFVSYLKREQYGYRPLMYGQYFTAKLVDQKQGAPIYYKGKEKYEIVDYDLINEFDPNQQTILPRIYSTNARHQQIYRSKLGLREGQKPTFADNISFMFSHQMGHMYWRYFMWNFAGRESDIQDATWLTPMDAFKELPETIARNKGRNNYLMLPFILGLLGMLIHYKKDLKTFWVVMGLFLMMGLVLVAYLNSPPVEPRERDYIYVGSFYAYAIWIGLGVLALAAGLQRLLKSSKTAALAAGLLTLPIPLLMAAENWDDHDRTDRYFSIDSARNFLAGLAPNAILFTGGDNDTFPLWYVQEVEGFRTDVRVIVLSYFDTDWYIDQLQLKMNDSEPLPITLDESDYRRGTNDLLYMVERLPSIDAGLYINALKQKSKALQLQSQSSSVFNMIPSKMVTVEVDTALVKEKGLIPEKLQQFATSQLQIAVKGEYITKGSMVLLDLLANNNWERPIYLNNTSVETLDLELKPHVVMEGNVYRLLPIRKPTQLEELVDTEKSYDLVMNQFRFTEVDNPNVYLSEDYRNFLSNHRSTFNSVAIALINEDNYEQAKEVMYKSLEVMPDKSVLYDFSTAQSIPILFELGEDELAIEITDTMSSRAISLLNYYIREDKEFDREAYLSLQMLSIFGPMLNEEGYREKAILIQQSLEQLYKRQEAKLISPKSDIEQR